MTSPDVYAATRRRLHAVAEHVVGAALHRATGRIGLRPTPGGFGTPVFEADGRRRQVRVEGVEIVAVVVDDAAERRAPIETLGRAAAVVGIDPGAPADVYFPATPLDPDAPLDLDPVAADLVHRWFHAGAEAIEELRRLHADDAPAVAQLWPEHFDLATTIAEVNYGCSPGDDEHPWPYAYVGPWDTSGLASGAGSDDGLWNEPFGASRTWTPEDPPKPADILAFFQRGHDQLTATRPTTTTTTTTSTTSTTSRPEHPR